MSANQTQTERRTPTPWRARWLAGAVFVVSGILFTSKLVAGEARSRELAVLDYLPFISELMLSHAVGGAIAGAICAPLFGRAGGLGVALAVVGALAATLLSGILGGAAATLPTVLASGAPLVQLAIGMGVGAATVPFAAAGAPAMALAWLALMVAAHLLVRHARRRVA